MDNTALYAELLKIRAEIKKLSNLVGLLVYKPKYYEQEVDGFQSDAEKRDESMK